MPKPTATITITQATNIMPFGNVFHTPDWSKDFQQASRSHELRVRVEVVLLQTWS